MFRAEGCDNIIRGGCATPTSSAWSASGYQPRALFFYALLYTIAKKCQGEQKEVMQMVLPWWVAALAFVFGALLGAMVAAVLIEDEKELRR